MSAWTPPRSFDGYVLTRKIGEGSMGQVYLATDTLLDRLVAIKLISAADAGVEERRRFLVEARAIARLQHPNVVAVYRVGEVAGNPYLASEFVRGEGLDRLPLPLPWARALAIGIGIARGLAAAHQRGVVHRDVKPANILITADGEPKLLDFGIARVLDPEVISRAGRVSARRPDAAQTRAPPDRSSSAPAGIELGGAPTASSPPEAMRLTQGGRILGTPLYLAPELWDGDEATFRSDVYSLGALLYALCAGEPPHVGKSLDELRASVLGRCAQPLRAVAPGVDPRFAAVVDRCLDRDPARRFSSGDEVVVALAQLSPEARDVAVPEGNPYRGLHAFEGEHRALFFGRDLEIRAILERLRADPCVAVAGDSGVGKSSLCRAGVLPRLPAWLGGARSFSVVTVVPGKRPLAALASALAPSLGADEGELARRVVEDPVSVARALRGALGETRGLVLFLDQLEELVTLADPREAAACAELLGWLVAPSASVRVLAAVRGDFLGRLAALPSLGDAIARSLYILRPLGAERIREAVVGPARALGVTFESDAMVGELVAPTVRAEGGLPLLQFALAELWEARDPRRQLIPASALAAMGGVGGALGRHADDVVARMVPEVARAARRILLRLVTASGTRSRATDEELASGDPVARVALEALVSGRLLVARQGTDRSGYEIAHEALLHGWGTLAGWLSGSAEGKAARQRLAAAVSEWCRLGRAREALWSARRLAELSAVEPSELSPTELAFVEASAREGRRTRRLRGAALLAVPLALTMGYTGITLETRRELAQRIDARVSRAAAALTEARVVRERAAAARSRALGLFDSLDREQAEEAWARALALGATLDDGYGRASQELESALLLDPSRGDLRARFADLLYERAVGADDQRSLAQRDELLRRLAVYDEGGERARRFLAPAHLGITTTPAGARIRLQRANPGELDPALELDPSPIADRSLEVGSYLVTLAAPGRVTVRYPITVRRGERLDLAIDLPPLADVPTGYAYIPPGRFLFGSADDDRLRRTFFNTAPLHEAHTGAYLIALRETTFADWIEYLRALPRAERSAHAPGIDSGGLKGALVFRELPDGTFELTFQPAARRYTALSGGMVTYPARALRVAQDWRRFPVFGVDVADAQAYLGWLDASGKLPGARLCTEQEWERAARGSDDRPFPHGMKLDPDDADFDETYGKAPLGIGPDEVGSHPASRSPFGLDDMAGNVWEWTTSSLARGEFTARGGSYYFDATSNRSDNRQVSEPTLRDASVGLRVCADARRAVVSQRGRGADAPAASPEAPR